MTKKHHFKPFNLHFIAVDPSRNTLGVGAQEVRIEPLLMSLLVRLVQAEGATVSRQELLQDVWSNDEGSDEALSQAISRLRKALDRQLQNTSRSLLAGDALIETIPKVGYRLVIDTDTNQASEAEADSQMTTVFETRLIQGDDKRLRQQWSKQENSGQKSEQRPKLRIQQTHLLWLAIAVLMLLVAVQFMRQPQIEKREIEIYLDEPPSLG